MTARNRLLQELKELSRNPEPDINLSMDEDAMEKWLGIVTGPKGSPYEGGKFKLEINCPSNYPMAPPTVTFKTQCFHPNVDNRTGELCLDILKTDWSPAWTLQYVICFFFQIFHCFLFFD